MISLRLGTLYAAVIILVSCGDRTPSPVIDATVQMATMARGADGKRLRYQDLVAT